MTEAYSNEPYDSLTPPHEEVAGILEATFETDQVSDWVALGTSSRTVVRRGIDAELPNPNLFDSWVREADEWLVIYGRPVQIGEIPTSFFEGA